MRHYLDANATEPLRPEARDAMLATLGATGNPASVHREGRAARRILEDARETIAARFGTQPEHVVFTSGATEANALALHALRGNRRLILGATEHDSVLIHAPGARLLEVDREGIADLASLAEMLAEGPALVALMLANNETGTLQPVAEAAALCRRHGALLHVDAVQAAGRMPVDLAALGAHSLALSSHKLGGPPGAGALLLAADAPAAQPLIPGGGQERGWRGGTPALPAIAGFAAAASAGDGATRLGPIRDSIEDAAICQGAVVCSAGARRLANTDLPRFAGRAGRCAGDGARPGRDRGQRRGRVQLRQGDRQPCARGDGPWRAGRSGHSGVPAVERGRKLRRGVFRRLCAHGRPAAQRAARPLGAPGRLTPHRLIMPTAESPPRPPTRPNRPVYLDNQATTRCDPRVVAAMLPYFSEQYGNPHSVEHVMGRVAEAAVEDARAALAGLIGADPKEIVFTSGATESNNIAIKGAARHAARADTTRRRIITVATEHKCVLESVGDLAGEGFEPVFLPVDADGLLDPDALREALTVPTLLVSIMTVNNETGVIQDIPALAEIAKTAGALFHTDAAQAVGKIGVDVTAWRVDLLSISGHKFYGPKGVGALYVRRRPRVRLAPVFSGGGQERGLRSGTLPAPLIVGLGRGRPSGGNGDGTGSCPNRRSARPAAGAAVGEHSGSGGEWQHGGAHSGQPEPDLPRRDRRRTDGADARALRVHRLRLLLGGARAVLCAARPGTAGRSGGAQLALRDRALYLGRRHRLCGRGPGGGACRCPGLNGSHAMPTMTFIERDGTRREVDAPLGLSVLEIAHKHGVDIEGACEGSLACSTCHVVVDPGWFGRLADPTEDEEDMLDLAFGLTETSRLGCQIVMTETLDGLVVKLPAGSRNLLNE